MTDSLDRRISKALDVIADFGGIDGAHHKQWVLDQVVRELTGDKYPEFVRDLESEGIEWYTGIAP